MMGSPRARLYCDRLSDDEPHHFLDSCFLCKKPLFGNCDIFMYRFVPQLPHRVSLIIQSFLERSEGTFVNLRFSGDLGDVLGIGR